MRDEFELAVFEPAVILPTQMMPRSHDDGDTSGVRGLMLAILEDVMLCIARGRIRRHPRTQELAAEAVTWIRSECREWLFSFASICDVLGFDAEALRARLLADAVPRENQRPTGQEDRSVLLECHNIRIDTHGESR